MNNRADGRVLVIGAGIAGLWTALSIAPRPVTLLTAGALGEGSSSWAQGGLAAALGDNDAPSLHTKDTVAAGGGLCDQHAVDVLTHGGADAVKALADLGVPFDRHADGSFALGCEAAHSVDRIVHVGGDEAGLAITRSLIRHARASDHIEIVEDCVAERLIVRDQRIVGAKVWLRRAKQSAVFAASAVVLATGGVGGLFAVTTNPLSSQGHGLALAAWAGATLRDLEFVQFHPTALNVDRDPAPLATEAIRGAGGLLRDGHGHRFMTDIHPSAELAPRDIVARGVAEALSKTGDALLDITPIGDDQVFAERFPTVAQACIEAGINLKSGQFPVAPAAHYHMGGVKTGLYGETDVDGLFAVGECASTGIHGANRLASNSLLEAIVFGTRLGEFLRDEKLPDVSSHGASADRPGHLPHSPPTVLPSLREAMTRGVGMARTEASLHEALAALDELSLQTMGDEMVMTTARLIVLSALSRKESRGSHQHGDYPDTDSPAKHTLIKFADSGASSANADPMIWQEAA